MVGRTLLVWLAIFIVWALYRSTITTYEWIDELLVKPLIFVGPVLYMTLKYHKDSISSLGFSSHPRHIFLDLYVGVIIGVLFAFEGLYANYLKNGDFSFTPIPAVAASAGLAPFLLTNLATAVSEEILGRGYLYQQLLRATGKQYPAAAVSSFLFLLLHVPILFLRLNLSGTALVTYLASVFFLGFTNCYLLSWRKSLTVPILIHLFWNMTIALYL